MIHLKTRTWRFFHLIALWSLSGQIGFSQDLQLLFQRFTEEDGLSQITINDIHQDSAGFLWLATNKGLTRYDGYEFKIYQHDPTDSTSLTKKFISSTCTDQYGQLWITSWDGGVFRLGADHETITRIFPNQDDPIGKDILSGNYVYSSRSGNLWLAAGNGIFQVAPETGMALQRLNDHPDFPIREGFGIRNITEDEDGTLWFSGNGLIHYDRATEKFEYVTPDEVFSGQKAENFITAFLIDNQGRQWIGTPSGTIFIRDTPQDDFRPFHPDPGRLERLQPGRASNSGSQKNIMTIYEDSRQKIWIGQLDVGLFHLDPETGALQHFQSDPENPHSLSGGNRVSDILEAHDGAIWVGTWGGLNRVTPTFRGFSQQFFGETEVQYLRGFSNTSLLSIYQDLQGKLWLGTGQGLEWRDNQNSDRRHFDLGDWNGYPVTTIQEDQKGFLWAGVYGKGLVRINRKTGDFQTFPEVQGSQRALPDPYIRSIFEDPDGNLWILTLGGGLSYFDLEKEQLNPIYTTSKYSEETFAWLKTLEREGRELGRLTPTGRGTFVTSIEVEEEIPVLIVAAVGMYYEVRPFTAAELKSEGEIKWAIQPERSRHDGGLLFNRLQIEADTLKAGNYEIQFSDYIGGIRENDWNGNPPNHPEYWGLRVFSLKGKEVPAALFDSEASPALPDMYALSVQQDGQGRVWVGTERGFYRWDEDDKSFVYNPALPEPGSLFYDVETDAAGNWWVSTYGILQGTEQMLHLHPDTGLITRLTRKDGLPFQYTAGIEIDDYGNIWMGSASPKKHAIAVYNPANQKFRTFGEEDNIRSFHYQIGASFRTGEGSLFFGGQEGFTKIDPRFVLNNKPPKVSLTGLRIFDEVEKPGSGRVLGEALSRTEQLNLAYRQNDITIEYVGINFIRPDDIQYAYRLDPYEEEWRYVGNRREAIYPNLPPGRYNFRVKAANSNGVWSEEQQLQILIRPPWWQTTWAYLLYVLSVIGLLYFIRRMELRRQHLKLQREQEKLERERRVNEELRRVDELKDQFLANTSHELRTPLNGIIGLAESLRDGAAGALPEKARANLEMIRSSGKRLASLVNDILDFSKLKNKDLELNRRPTDLHAAVEVVLQLSEPLVKNKAVDLINAVPADLPLVEADENRLQQILHNLVGNAIKFTEKGYVKVGISSFQDSTGDNPGKMTRIYVEDTGIGIPKDKQALIFQSFEQGDGSTAREYGGTGLGLAVTKQLVERHGGTIEVTSEPGKGARFEFILPLSDAERESSPPIEVPEAMEKISVPEEVSTENGKTLAGTLAASVSSGSGRILIVDDEPVNLQVLENHLSLAGYEVHQASNGSEALEVIRERGPFDLLILDVMMPRMSGYEVCNHLRDEYLPSQLPVVMLTAKNRVVDLIEGFHAGANDYLTKPFSKDELLTRIRTHLNLHRINRVTGKFVPYEFLRSLGRDAITDVQLGDQTQREVTVCFADIRDYTRLAETMTPEENFKFVNAFHRRMGPIVRQHHGFINQYLGDAIMAIFPGSPIDALNAAVDMQLRLQRYNQERIAKSESRKAIRMGIGLHTGPLIMGIIGDEQRMDAATISDAVNTASRIESLTKHFGVNILVTEDSAERTNAATLRFLGRVLVKGKAQPISVYECFDGDTPEVKAKKKQTQAQFQDGLDAYFERRFAHAAGLFQQIIDENPKDDAAKVYLNKAGQYITTGVPEDWRGVEVVDK